MTGRNPDSEDLHEAPPVLFFKPGLKPHVFNELLHFTLIPVFMAKHYVRLDRWPEMTAWYETITARPAFQASLPPEGAARLFDREFYEPWEVGASG